MCALVALTDRRLDDCARLFATVFSAPPWDEGWTLAAARARLAEILKTPGAAGLAWVEEKPVGLVAGYCERDAGGHMFYLKEMCVRPDRQRQGIGARLLAAWEERLRKSGVRQIYLMTRRGGPAEAFYAANGFRRILAGPGSVAGRKNCCRKAVCSANDQLPRLSTFPMAMIRRVVS